jgi:hypothetical protein
MVGLRVSLRLCSAKLRLLFLANPSKEDGFTSKRGSMDFLPFPSEERKGKKTETLANPGAFTIVKSPFLKAGWAGAPSAPKKHPSLQLS